MPSPRKLGSREDHEADRQSFEALKMLLEGKLQSEIAERTGMSLAAVSLLKKECGYFNEPRRPGK